MQDLISRLQIHVEHGTKIFWVTPCLSPVSSWPSSSADERSKYLQTFFPGLVNVVHGQLSADEKLTRMESFTNGTCQVLVATTVVEVGVDVRDASICVVERAENFGLSQLHQIRGRIGRGNAPKGEQLNGCYCILMYDDSEDKASTSTTKLQSLVENSDGFEVAEIDLQQRGPGEAIGRRQHGNFSSRCLSRLNI